ncbi:methyl-accepting chemotaxis protein [Phaeobacter gallaeciensis]|uniref:Methyl-accepting chemotaxis protein n=1 Tax=Phaeobacter gallaeciensis TaxID=60890 RepID=A0AAC9Z9I4_9RHOB|nr:methyl-accepting chemotaxis protein [Phaeobacter gallaeciensis]AHD09744.1 Methyl-accepting chemotaxis protein [Phaeobacter gallaeciensis DSM 26640]ATE93008.1 Methyl-accepting chemotaxis protein [Phaeobacter gallaeciensis]ATE97170.1 Methyl-accepting chemotaxis protein [Phaeobacter gallaeciensis]ATF01673.1 Methyl-accepting chemotaxis protein [Phaeobacter gallaeciensis]ATF06053.1 Methyl-accepting chemotaxis protein [Phaeobacter gallaeciensis]
MITRLLQQMSIRTKILTLVGVPLLIIIGMSGAVLYTLNKRASFDTSLTQDIMITVEELVHNLQLERGMSSAFLTGDASAFPQALTDQRQKAQDLRIHMLEVMETADLSQLHENTRIFVDLAHEELEALDGVRTQIENRSISAPEMIDFYTDLNIHLLETALAFEVLVPDTELAERAMAFTYFQMAKDAYGIQRAVGAEGFANGWSEQLRTRMTISYLQSKERMRVFHELSDSKSVHLFDERAEGEIYQTFAKIREKIFANAAPENITSEQWFKIATDAIAVVKDVETHIRDELIADFQAFDAYNNNAFYQTLTGLSVVLVLVSLAAMAIARDIAGGVRMVTGALEQISSGDLDVDISGKSRKDAIGNIARQADILRGHAVEKRAADDQLDRAMTEQKQVSDAIANALNQLSHKVLIYRLDDEFPEDFKSLRMDFNDLAQSLQDAMDTVRSAALSVGDDSQTIAANMDDLSRRTESQAAALERSTHAMNEITTSVGESARNAKDAETIAGTTQDKVNDCEEIVQKTVTAMQEIRTSSDEISQITKVIEDIAFQTNLLALNAGVEAARAGEAGRGFAVVASEVQRLAQRCSDAVSQIDEITARSSSQVNTGSTLVGSAGTAMADVSTQVSAISELIVSIAKGLDAQSSQLSEVNHAVGEMEQMTQTNAAMTEETTASATQLFQQARELNTMIGAFQLDGPPTSSTPEAMASDAEMAAQMAGTDEGASDFSDAGRFDDPDDESWVA